MPNLRRAAARILHSAAQSAPTGQPPRPALGHKPPTDPLPLVRQIQEGASALHVDLFAIPGMWTDPIRFGVTRADIQRLVEHLSRQNPHLHVTGRPFGTSWKASRTVPASQIGRLLSDDPASVYLHSEPEAATNKYDVLFIAGAVELDIWDRTSSGTYTSRTGNLHAGEIAETTPSVTVTTRGIPLLTVPDFTAPTPDQCLFPIDAVYLWVDGSDPQWQSRRDARLTERGQPPAPESASESRFRQHDELKYSLRSMSAFAPWIRHVYIVTDKQHPEWLDVDNPNVTVVDHTDILPGDSLPTFNSHALSANAHRIPGLSEHFLYMNDDVFFGRPVDPTSWFAATGAARIHYTASRGSGISVTNSTVPVQARRNATHLMAPTLGFAQHRNLQHGPHPIITTVMQDAWARFPEHLKHTSGNAFRDPSDVEPVWLHNALGMHLGQVSEGNELTYRYVLMDAPESDKILSVTLRNRDRDIFCLNDAHADDTQDEEDRAARYGEFLEAYFPWKSPYER